MTLYDVWMVSPQNHMFVIEGNTRTEYEGTKDGADREVEQIVATSYPMYAHVLEVHLKKQNQ